MLHQIFGGVESNPDYALAKQAESAPFVEAGSPTEQALRSGGAQQPFRAKTFFDRADASAANAGYLADESAADSAANRQVGVFRDLMPLKKQALRDEAEVELETLPKQNELAASHQQNLANIELQKMLRMPGSQENLAALFQQYGPEQLQRIIAEAKAGTTIANTANTQSGIEGEVAITTRPQVLANAPKKLDYEGKLIEQNIDLLPFRKSGEIDDIRQRGALGDMKLEIGGLIPVNGGIFDAMQGGYRVAPEVTSQEAMQRKALGLPPQTYPMVTPKINGADNVSINGVPYRGVKSTQPAQAPAADNTPEQPPLTTNTVPNSDLIPGAGSLGRGLLKVGTTLGSNARDIGSGRALGELTGRQLAEIINSVRENFKAKYVRPPQNADR